MTFYIKTGEKVSGPHHFPVWAKILAAGFACYFFWITVEYMKMVYIEPEIARLYASEKAKYEVVDRLEALDVELDKTIANTNLMLDALKEDLPE